MTLEHVTNEAVLEVNPYCGIEHSNLALVVAPWKCQNELETSLIAEKLLNLILSHANSSSE